MKKNMKVVVDSSQVIQLLYFSRKGLVLLKITMFDGIYRCCRRLEGVR